MKLIILALHLLFWTSQGSSDFEERHGVLVEDVLNGTTYRFTNMQDNTVLTVLPNGDVITDIWKNLQTQKWTVINHPRSRLFVEIRQKVVPYNMLSGYKPVDESDEEYPRALILTKHRIMPTLKDNRNELSPIPWQILIDSSCLQSNGVGRFIDYAECEYQPAPWQFWNLEVEQS